MKLKLRKPYYTGQTKLILEPKAFLKRLFAIIPPPRWHLTRYHGIFSSHHRRRSRLKALVPETSTRDRTVAAPDPDTSAAPRPDNPARLSYAKLLSRVFEGEIDRCHRCNGELRLIACIDEPDAIAKILTHLGLPTEAPQPAPARSPPQLEFGAWDED